MKHASLVRLSTSVLAIVLTAFAFAAFAAPAAAGKKTAKKRKPAQAGESQLILIAVDGLSRNAFETARKMGLLKDFKAGSHIAPFPSMSDVSWNSIMRTTEVFGDQGRLKSAEAVYFDESTRSIAGDPRDYYRRQAHAKYYMGAFEFFLNPYIESLMYFPTEEIPKLEVKQVVDDLLASPRKPVLTGFIAATDSMAHTQKNKLYPIVRAIDAELKRLAAGFRERGVEPRIVLVSDHGNVGRFPEGADDEIELAKIEIGDELKSLGYRFTPELKESNDVAIPLLALGSWAPVYVKDRRNLPALARGLSAKPWFDLAVYIKANDADALTMAVYGPGAVAEVSYDKRSRLYSYRNLEGNALGLADAAGLDATEAMKRTVGTAYPDSLARLIDAGLHKEFDFPDMIVTSKDGTCFDHSLGGFTKMYRTHGSLTRDASLGIVAANFGTVPEYLRSADVLKTFGIDAARLYGREFELSRQTAGAAFDKARLQLSRGQGVATDARDFSTKRVFRYLTRFVADTRPFFVIDELKQLLSAFTSNPFLQKPTSAAPSFDPSKLDYKSLLTPEDLGKLTDEVIRAPNPESVTRGPVFQSLVARLKARTGRTGDSARIPGPGGAGVAAKRTGMKLYQTPFLLERALTLQEKTRVKDPRDLHFAQYWLRNKAALIKDVRHDVRAVSPQGGSAAGRLFAEVFKESQLAERLYPAPLDRIYNARLKDLTVVYVPGIYNAIFDKEIFALGLLKIEEDLGLRVLRAPVESMCSTRYNGRLLMDFLKRDSADRVARGHEKPKYLLLSYSKGAPDALAGFVQDPAWVSDNVEALVSVAGPLHGSSILNRADLPFDLVEALSDKGAPEICKTAEPAGKSITPSAMTNFWRRNGRALTGLTRYYSVSFSSEIEDSHLFMRATKLLAQFDEDNDGVVTVSSSRFPDYIGAVDFGVVEADHLSGVLSSRFDQKAFMDALVTSLAEVGAEDAAFNRQSRLARIVELANRGAKSGKLYVRTSGGRTHVYRSTLYGLSGREVAAGEKTSFEWNRLLLPKVNDPADSYEPKARLPDNNLKYDPYALIDLRKLMGAELATARVKPMTPREFPEGVDMTFNHKNAVHFRMDHQLNYESSVQHNADDNAVDGLNPVDRGGRPWLQMASKGTSIRATTLAYRFKPVDYPKTTLVMNVTKPVAGADVVKGGSGKDDSAFQVWLTLRVGNSTNDRASIDPQKDRLVLFGYYWGAKDSAKETRAGQLFENYYSNKNYPGIATLPEAKEVLLEDPKALNKDLTLTRDLAEDLKRAFPNVRPEDLEVIAITLQHDSNDTKTESEVFFKSLKFGR